MVKNRFSLLSLFFLVGCYCSAQTAFEKKISDLGFSEIVTDWSDSAEINIPKPKCAYVNVTGMTDIPPKGFPLKGWFEVYDGNGNYFKKRILMDGQGQTSRKADKKNFEVDFCDDLWLNDSTPEITIGDWVDQDSYHFKAFYSDFLRGTGIIAYQVYDEMTNDRGEYGRMWERALENIKNPDTNARCFPDAFPCVVYMNGKFYGLYCWQLKKHRKNMNLKKNNGEHVHLHGFMNNNFFKGIFMAPHAVKQALKTAVYTAYMMEKLGYTNVSPKYNEKRTDIIQTVELGNKDSLVSFTQGIQESSPIDSFVKVLPAPMPGYPFDEVMACGAFTQGSTIELSADAPVVEPYTLYLQGGLSLEYGRLSIMLALSKAKKHRI